MKFRYNMATKVFFGKACMWENRSEIIKCGRRCMIVTGKHSGKASGALDDMIKVLKELSIDYIVFDRVENNPSFKTVKEGGNIAAGFNADFIVGIGGGSPLDASKAVAVLAVNDDMEPLGLFENTFANRPLPVIAIPTTAGTGSEVTPYSILTRDDLLTKKSFGNDDTFPKIAFSDASYTEGLPYDVTVNTAVDALSHAIEGYISKRSTVMSDILAAEAVSIFGECITNLVNNNFCFETREKLLYMSMLAGMVISHTGTTILHSMGYELTYFYGVPHGKANGLLMSEYLKFNYECAGPKIDRVISFLKLKDIDELGCVIDKLMTGNLKLTDAEIEKYAAIAVNQKSASYNIRKVTADDVVRMYKNVLIREQR